MKRVCVIDLPGLSHELLAAVPADMPLGKWLERQRVAALEPSFPALTCSVHATLTTGAWPAAHGIIANGIATYRSPEDQALVDPENFAEYRREVSFWEQSNQLVQQRRFWQDDSGQSRYKTALLFFQNAMPGFQGESSPAADIVITPKPQHGPDGETISLIWTHPTDLGARLSADLGPFPLMNYWGPFAGIQASQWIVQAALRVWVDHQPQLQLVYVPHLDYDLQRFGPSSPQAQQAVADVAQALSPLIEHLEREQAAIVLLSDYAMQDVNRSIAPNRLFADAGLLKTRNTPDGRLIDYQTSQAFAMADHQVAHVYLNDESATQPVRSVLDQAGVRLMDKTELGLLHLNHRRSGDLVAVAPEGAWFDYRWWSDPAAAPSFATTVDIHRKPGYDALELFFDPAVRGITQDATRIRGSHGGMVKADAMLATSADLHQGSRLRMIDVAGIVQKAMTQQ